MRHKSTTDYQHFLEDLAGMYPFAIKKEVPNEVLRFPLGSR
jgi:hypothetical protein